VTFSEIKIIASGARRLYRAIIMSDKKLSVRFLGAVLVYGLILGFSSCVSKPADPAGASLRQHTLLDADWLFHRGDLLSGDQTAAVAADFNDQSWDRVQIPHDYTLDGAYAPSNDRGHGYLPFPVAWYRKHFTAPPSDQGKILQLEFGGIFRESDVWLNGKLLGHHRSGYTGFIYDVTKVVHLGADNVITVRVDPAQFEGWWNEGAGIYRHVYYNAVAPLHLLPGGVYVISQVPGGNQGADALANITIETTVTNNNFTPARSSVTSEILGPDGSPLKTLHSDETVPANSQAQTVQQAVLPHPRLWSPDSPQLYQVRTTILQDGQPVDSGNATFGVRTIFYDADKGFFLNGKHVEIHGVANHQDFAGVGIGVPDSLQPWRVMQLKRMGCNGWRTAHNPPNEAVLDACDRLGMLVMDENRHLGDAYTHHSRKGTTYTNFSDLAWMIQRDRNHPSVIMWSMCNEENMQGEKEGATIFSAMMKVVHRYDQTRPITCAMSGGWFGPGLCTVEDIIGVNYSPNKYDQVHKTYPRKPVFASETANNKTARGNYTEDRTNGWSSSYNLTDPGWLPVVERPFMAGIYVWTGFDYKGEPNPNGWPDVANNTGLVDSCGFPKDKYYYFESCWSEKPMAHLMPTCWNWPDSEDKPIRVIAVSNAKQVELFLNGQSFGVKTMPSNGHVEWQVPFKPGRLEAKATTNGRLVATDIVETTGAPATLKLSPDREQLHADAQDTVVAPISILDAKGRVVPTANNRVTFQLTGGGRILGVGNGNPSDHETDRASQRNAFNGHCIAVIQSGTSPETLQLTATSPGLAPATVTFHVK
jgi:beta-galactosidase